MGSPHYTFQAGFISEAAVDCVPQITKDFAFSGVHGHHIFLRPIWELYSLMRHFWLTLGVTLSLEDRV